MNPRVPSSTRFDPVDDLLLRDRNARMVVGQFVLDRPGMPTVRRVPEQLISRGGDGLDARMLQEAYAAERAADPRLLG